MGLGTNLPGTILSGTILSGMAQGGRGKREEGRGKGEAGRGKREAEIPMVMDGCKRRGTFWCERLACAAEGLGHMEVSWSLP